MIGADCKDQPFIKYGGQMSEQEIINMLEHILIEFRAMDVENRKNFDDFCAVRMWSETLKNYETGGFIK